MKLKTRPFGIPGLFLLALSACTLVPQRQIEREIHAGDPATAERPAQIQSAEILALFPGHHMYTTSNRDPGSTVMNTLRTDLLSRFDAYVGAVMQETGFDLVVEMGTPAAAEEMPDITWHVLRLAVIELDSAATRAHKLPLLADLIRIEENLWGLREDAKGLFADVTRLEGKNEALSGTLTQRNEHIDRLVQDIFELRRARDEKVAQLKDVIAERDESIAKLEKQNFELSSSLAGLKAKSDTTIYSLRKKIGSRDEALAALRAEFEATRKDLEAKLAKSQGEKAALKEEYAAAVAAFGKELTAREKALEAFRALLAQTRANIEKRLAASAQENADLQAELAQLRKERDTTLAELAKKIAGHESALAKFRSELAIARAGFEERLTESAIEKAKLAEALEASGRKNAEMEKALAKLGEEHAKAVQAGKKLTKTVGDRDKEIADLRTKVEAAEKELARWKDLAGKLEKDRTARMALIQKNTAKMQGQIADLHKLLKKISTETPEKEGLEELRTRIEQLEESMPTEGEDTSQE
jgi:chromosome segregation ATPase